MPTLEAVLRQLHNKCEIPRAARSGTYTVASGTLDFPGLLPGQYYWVEGSVLNDGLHQHPAMDLSDETFTGQIIPAKIDRELVQIVDEINAWEKDNPKTDKVSESFGGYSFSRATVNGRPLTWWDAFAPRLAPWRRL